MNRSIGRDRQRGTTLLETVVVIAVLATLSAIVVESLVGLARTQRRAERRADVLAVAERTIQGVLADVDTAFLVFTDDERGRAMWARLAPDTAPCLPDARLPVETARGVFEPDPTGEFETGNTLLIGRSLAPIEVIYGVEPGDVARVDVLQVVMYHLARIGERVELMRWASVPLARADDIAAVADSTAREAVIADLYAQGIRLAWRPDASPEGWFFGLTAAGGTARPEQGFHLPRSSLESRDDLLGARGVAVVENGSVPAAHVPSFGAAVGDFPHGFEIKLDGDGAGRLLLIRLALTAYRGGDRRDVHAVVERLVPFRGEQ